MGMAAMEGGGPLILENSHCGFLTEVKLYMKTYAIRWKSSNTGTTGTGTKRFEKEDAERLAKELNEDYPNIDHEAVIPAPPMPAGFPIAEAA
jgi:hypothetical protein